MAMNWPAEIKKWQQEQRDKLVAAEIKKWQQEQRDKLVADAPPPEKCPHCQGTRMEVKRYGTTGELGDVYCSNPKCGRYIRPWNTY